MATYSESRREAPRFRRGGRGKWTHPRYGQGEAGSTGALPAGLIRAAPDNWVRRVRGRRARTRREVDPWFPHSWRPAGAGAVAWFAPMADSQREGAEEGIEEGEVTKRCEGPHVGA